MDKIIDKPTNETIYRTSESLTIIAPKWYSLDASKIKTVEDVVNVLAALRINVEGGTRVFEELKPYLKVDENDYSTG